ncbi:phage tail protein [Escherichia sp. E3659]|uniref:phage tail-collar fiber domain-containing protein n=1 Tax=Escherichia sp. E3659 TaxID=2044462 RepID=UPI001F0E69D2|nr:phage tail protein [Escherichia sp. E3659]
MSALLTKAFEKWIAKCIAGNLPARPDAIVFALMNRDPSPEDNIIPPEKITYTVNKLTYGQLTPNSIVCSGAVTEDAEFSYDWICLVHQASGTLCGVIKTPVHHKHVGETLLRNFAITYSGMAQAAQITVPPQSWQMDIYPELKTMLKTANHLSEIAAEGEEAQQESRDNLGLKNAATMEPQSDIYDRTEGRLAIPGAFGFGHMFLPGELIRFDTEKDLLAWVKQATPGEYSVQGANGVLPGGYCGVINIRFLEANRNPPEPQHMAKAIILYTVNGDVYYNRYWPLSGGYLTGWDNLKTNEAYFLTLINARATLYSPVFTGAPKTPTPPDDATGTEIANAAFVRKLLAALVDSSPEALDTLNELAAALGNDPNFATTVTNALAGKQPLSDVLTAISNLKARADKLLCFDTEGNASLSTLSEMARTLLMQETLADMHTILELGKAATLEPQGDIHDRTADRLAIPGAFGFGHIFLPDEVIRFNSENDFLAWVRKAEPGEYLVDGSNKIIPDVLFKGMVRIRWVESEYGVPNPRHTVKVITFYGINGNIYHNRYWTSGNGYLIGWESLKFTTQNVIDLLSGIAPGATDAWYGTGSLVLAAYRGSDSSDQNRRIMRGYYYPGSRLSAVEFKGHFTSNVAGVYDGNVSAYFRDSGAGLPGTVPGIVWRHDGIG